MFGGAYESETNSSERPKYGALHLMLHGDGPASNFGSCYFLLRPQVSHRATFTYLDSHLDPINKGSYRQFDDIMAPLLKDTFSMEFALGEKNLTPPRLMDHLMNKLQQPFRDPSEEQSNHNLNHYIEAQVHGDISLQEDVEILVVDPSFKDTEVGRQLENLCSKYAIELYWHMGHELSVEDVPDNFRGPSMPSLAERIARNGHIDASVIGAAAVDLIRNPDAWSDRGSTKEVLQEIKMLWHVLVKYGKPIEKIIE